MSSLETVQECAERLDNYFLQGQGQGWSVRGRDTGPAASDLVGGSCSEDTEEDEKLVIYGLGTLCVCN